MDGNRNAQQSILSSNSRIRPAAFLRRCDLPEERLFHDLAEEMEDLLCAFWILAAASAGTVRHSPLTSTRRPPSRPVSAIVGASRAHHRLRLACEGGRELVVVAPAGQPRGPGSGAREDRNGLSCCARRVLRRGASRRPRTLRCHARTADGRDGTRPHAQGDAEIVTRRVPVPSSPGTGFRPPSHRQNVRNPG